MNAYLLAGIAIGLLAAAGVGLVMAVGIHSRGITNRARIHGADLWDQDPQRTLGEDKLPIGEFHSEGELW